MKTQQIQIRDPERLAAALAGIENAEATDLVVVFGSPALLAAAPVYRTLGALMPKAVLCGCSTAGEITATGIADDTLVITAVRFDRIRASSAETTLADMDDSYAAGVRLGAQLPGDGLAALLVFGQGVAINGSALIDGLRAAVGDAVPITGGLAGDGTRFGETVVLTPSGPSSRQLVAVGLHGDALRFAHGSFGGWEPFGTLRRVTRCLGNVLFELDGRPALDIYKEYLGEYAKDLPSSGLLFPFEMIDRAQASTGVIRTILGIDEKEGSLTLAGDIHPDGYLQLMHASTDRLVSGAEEAARAAMAMSGDPDAGLGILVSCVGRKLVMGERVDEEIEAVAEIFGRNTVLAGFYSYGEISPFAPGASCRLHNQTMTITWIGETS